MASEVGIDLGTANVLVYIKNKGIVLNEPSVVAINKDTDDILAVGEEARQMLGRTPANIIAVRPLRDGVISDYDITERMLKYFIKKTCGSGRFFKPKIMVCVPSGVTEVEKRAVREAATQAGGKDVYLMEEPVAAVQVLTFHSLTVLWSSISAAVRRILLLFLLAALLQALPLRLQGTSSMTPLLNI